MTYLERIKKDFGQYIDKEVNGNYCIDDCRAFDDGCWIYLKEEYISIPMQCHTIHEDSFRECYKVLKQGILTINKM